MWTNRSKEEIPENLDEILPTDMKYSFFRLLGNHPEPKIRYLKKWMDANVGFETAIIIATLVIEGSIVLPHGEDSIESEIYRALKDNILEFGALSIFTGIWNADTESYSDSINTMKILAAKYEAETGGSRPVTLEELKQMGSQ